MSSKTEQYANICVVGGGPAGALVAYGLSMKGYKVTLFEAYPHPHQAEKLGTKAYYIVLTRGQRVLDSLGLANLPGKMEPEGKNKTRPLSVAYGRNTLSASLLDKALEAGTKLIFSHRLVDINLESKVATFETTRKRRVQFQYDVLVGCDGVHSQTREILSELVPDFTVRTENDTMEYQVAVLPGRLESYLKEESTKCAFKNKVMRSWNHRPTNSMCLAFPHEEGGTLFTIVFPGGELAAFAKKEDFHTPIQALLPELTSSARREIVQQLETSGPPAIGGTCVWVNRLVEGSIALVGDSAHGMWPSLGQGANCALESAAEFVHSAGTEKWLQNYQANRYEDAVAAVDLTFRGIGGKSSRHMNNAPLLFWAQIAIMMLLNKGTFGVIPKPAMLRLMFGDDVGYAKLYRWNDVYEKRVMWGAISVPFVLAGLWQLYKR